MVFGRRSSLRVPVTYRVDWHRRGSPTHVISTAKDWSRGGLFIRTTQAQPPGQTLSIRMDLGGGCVHVEGTVVHQSPNGMGVALDIAGARVV